MGKIYESFEQLKNENQSIFKRLDGLKYIGLFNAVWDARESEIDQLKQQYKTAQSQIENQNKQINSLKDQTLGLRQIPVLEKQLKLAQENLHKKNDYITPLENENKLIKAQKATLDQYQKKLEKSIQLKDRELQAAQYDLALSLEQQQILKNKKEELEKETKSQKSEVFRLETEMEKAQAFSKEYREMNTKLSHEIIRLKRRLAGHLPLELQN